MALNKRFDFGRDEDEPDDLRAKFAEAKREAEALKRENASLRKGQSRAPIDNSEPPSEPRKSSIFMLIATMLVIARVTVFGLVEHWGARLHELGMVVTGIAGLAVALMLVVWCVHETRHYGWLVVPGVIFLAVSILICASIYDPVLLETGLPGTETHPLVAAAGLVLTFLFAGTPFLFAVMGFGLLFITDPRRFFKK